MRDLMGSEMLVNDYLMAEAIKVFRLFGYEPLDTPALELWETLSAKGGEDIEAETFKFKDKGDRDVGLRFDLTVPLARIVACNPHLPKPFKRYAVGKVWRYDRPQAGRYREFGQADVDIIGAETTAADVEVVLVALEFFRRVLTRDYVIKVNNRKVLRGLIETAGVSDDLTFECFRAIDKLDKIGRDGVVEELRNRGVGAKETEFLIDAIAVKGKGVSTVEQIRELVKSSASGMKGADELTLMAEAFSESGVENVVEFDMSLARGLDYYTGPVFEGRYLGKPDVGSVAGGGRYDHLVERFGGPPTPATGISLGIGRLIDVAIAKGFGERLRPKLDAFVAPIKAPMIRYAIMVQKRLVEAGLSCEVDLMDRPLKKQLEQADTKGARFVVIVGARDIEKGEVSLRNMVTKETEPVKLEKIAERVGRGQ